MLEAPWFSGGSSEERERSWIQVEKLSEIRRMKILEIESFASKALQ